jgi:hypothetical protein
MRRFGILFSLFLLLLLSARSSNALDLMGWPNFNSVPDTAKNPKMTETPAARSKRPPLAHKQIEWHSWKDSSNYRFRTGSRDTGGGSWEHYIIFESRENVRFSEISYGSVKAPDVLLSPARPMAQIVLVSPSASYWQWNVTLYSPPKEPAQN